MKIHLALKTENIIKNNFFIHVNFFVFINYHIYHIYQKEKDILTFIHLYLEVKKLVLSTPKGT